MAGSQHADQCEVCILGAGIAGLNALVVAAQYLSSNHRRDREHHRATLDTIRERYDVRCGPLEHLTGQA
ncbi:hypothetical protein ACNO8X_16105 [Mycobacterium sp. PDNC021]|uniref:hypothetical protein n=1 Tax=Mycobacterium sp. PDNC021 TaxID=3391399 RepID=UPI003AAEB661